jgi:hypothetical protein
MLKEKEESSKGLAQLQMFRCLKLKKSLELEAREFQM